MSSSLGSLRLRVCAVLLPEGIDFLLTRHRPVLLAVMTGGQECDTDHGGDGDGCRDGGRLLDLADADCLRQGEMRARVTAVDPANCLCSVFMVHSR